MAIYTRGGDKGETSILGGKRVRKESQRVEAYGSIDELNSFVGLARSSIIDQEIKDILKDIQINLFTLGADLASHHETDNIERISTDYTKSTEELIDRISDTLSPLHHFVLPAGNEGSSLLHICRTVCRRAERRVTALAQNEHINPEIIPYLNRLSTLFFVMARLECKKQNIKEELWQG